MRAVFRCDASSTIGAGHLMRCTALAETFQRANFGIAFAGTAETFDSAPVRMLSSWTKFVITGDPELEAKELAARLERRCDIFVVDHYGRDCEFESACRSWASRIIAFEDLPNRRHDCDILLDTAGNTMKEEYAGLVPNHCRLLLGPMYAPLRRQFIDRRPASLQRRVKGLVERIFVSFGAADLSGATMVALDAIGRSGLDVHVDVAIGSVSPQLDHLKRRERVGVTIHVDCCDLASLMTSADLAIGACGASSWERCCLGLPSVVVTVAENQSRVASTLAEAGAAIHLGRLETNGALQLAEAIRALAADGARRTMMSNAAAALVDGLGGSRVLDTLP